MYRQNNWTYNAMEGKYFNCGSLHNVRQVFNMTVNCRLAQQTKLQEAPPPFIVGAPLYTTRRGQLRCFGIQEVQNRLRYSNEEKDEIYDGER